MKHDKARIAYWKHTMRLHEVIYPRHAHELWDGGTGVGSQGFLDVGIELDMKDRYIATVPPEFWSTLALQIFVMKSIRVIIQSLTFVFSDAYGKAVLSPSSRVRVSWLYIYPPV